MPDFNRVLGLLKEPVAPLVPEGVRAIDRGLANKSYVLTTEDGGKYVVRVLRAQTDESARAETLIQHALEGSGLRSPIYLEFKDGDVVAHVGEIRVTVSRFIEGKSPEKQSLALTRNLGVTLAKIHSALSGLPPRSIPESSAQAFRVKSIADDIARIPAGELATTLVERFEKLKSLQEKDLPRAIIHGDLFASNVFVENDEVTTVFDFETAQHTIRILDLARTHLENLEEKLLEPRESIRALFEGYDTVARVPITDDEKAIFDDAVRYVSVANAAWLRNNHSEESAWRTMSPVMF